MNSIHQFYVRYVELQSLLSSLKKLLDKERRLKFSLLENFSAVLLGNENEGCSFKVKEIRMEEVRLQYFYTKK